MKKREFFKRLFGVGVAAIVAPKALLAEETPKEVVVGDSETVKRYVSAIDLLDKREIKQPFNDRALIEEVVHKENHVAEIICSSDFFRSGDVVEIYRGKHRVGLPLLVTATSIVPAQSNAKKIRIIPAYTSGFDVKKGDILKCISNAYMEK